jgi:hypothetical protein
MPLRGNLSTGVKYGQVGDFDLKVSGLRMLSAFQKKPGRRASQKERARR